MSKTDIIKSIIATANSQFVSVEFEKKDKTIRQIIFNPKTAKGIKGDEASESAQQAVKTRKANNPNLISVSDNALRLKGEPAEKCWRSINCDTVKAIKIGGEVINFD